MGTRARPQRTVDEGRAEHAHRCASVMLVELLGSPAAGLKAMANPLVSSLCETATKWSSLR